MGRRELSRALLITLGSGSVAHAAITATLQLNNQQISPTGAATNTFYIAGAAATSRGTTPVLSGCAPAGAGITTGTLSGCATYFDSGFQPFDFGASAGTNGDPNGSNVLQFQLTSTVTGTAAASSYELVVFAYPTAGAGSKLYVPIASVGGTLCSNGAPCNTIGGTISYPTGGTTYYAVPFTPGSTLTVGIYPADICWSGASAIAEPGQTPTALVGCSNTNPVTGGGTSATGFYVDPFISGATTTGTQMEIEFDIFPAPTTPNTAPTGTASDSSIGYLLNFQSDTPTMVPSDNCPNLATSWQPGDSQIFLNNNPLSLDIANATSGTGAAEDLNHAPAQQVIVASVQGVGAAVPNVGATPTSAQATAESAWALGTQPPDFAFGTTPVAITGFKNVTSNASASGPSDPNTYQLQFMVRDSTGMVAVPILPSGGTACTLANVETSAIQGFLAGSSCFIATGAFRSATAAPVMLLRAFRDQVLLHSAPGRAFVHWYYGWSPPAALWLIDHPIFRFPVLLALVPVELLAWLALHPALFGLAALGALSALTVGACVRLGRNCGAADRSDKDNGGGRAGEF